MKDTRFILDKHRYLNREFIIYRIGDTLSVYVKNYNKVVESRLFAIDIGHLDHLSSHTVRPGQRADVTITGKPHCATVKITDMTDDKVIYEETLNLYVKLESRPIDSVSVNSRKRCFVTFTANGDRLLSSMLKDSIKEFSDYELLEFRHEDFAHLNVHVRYLTPRYIEKILSCTAALEKGYDEIVWLDSDMVVSHNIDEIWNYSYLLKDYPLLPKHDYWRSNGKVEIGKHPLKNELGYFNQLKTNHLDYPYLQACLMYFNRSSLSFFYEVLDLFKYVNDNTFMFGDESIINCMLCEYENPRNLGYVIVDDTPGSLHGISGINTETLATHGSKDPAVHYEILNHFKMLKINSLNKENK